MKNGMPKSAWLFLLTGLISGSTALLVTYLTLRAQRLKREEEEAMPIFDVRKGREQVSA